MKKYLHLILSLPFLCRVFVRARRKFPSTVVYVSGLICVETNAFFYVVTSDCMIYDGLFRVSYLSAFQTSHFVIDLEGKNKG